MHILGINFGHDCSAALISNGKVVGCIEEEKLSRIKQDFGWPAHAVKALLRQANLKPSDIDVIAFGSQNFAELSNCEIRFRFKKSLWRRGVELASRIGAYYVLWQRQFGSKNKVVFQVAVQDAGFSRATVHFFDHHLSHAASAWYVAPFQSDLVITCDGHGDGSSFNYYTMDAAGLKLLESNSYTTSIGQFYSAITQLLGFRPTRHEGKITGLAAFGQHTPLVRAFLSLFSHNEARQLERYPVETNPGTPGNLPWKTRVNLKTAEAFVGLDYACRGYQLLAKIKEMSEGFNKEDIAFACQKATESLVCSQTSTLIRKHFPNQKVRLALAGGVFANVRINQMLLELKEVENLFVQPAMGDAGLSLGGAILAGIAEGQLSVSTDALRLSDPYLGPTFSDTLDDFLASIQPETTVRKMANPAREIAQLLLENQIIGFWHGRMEWGPRALGHRSIILNTFDRKVNDTLNKRLNRTEFMPFAPAVIDYAAKKYFPKYDPDCPAADWMTITYDVAPEHQELLQAVVHVDGTARPQIVRQKANPYFYAVIDEFHKLSGCGAVVNTSFNTHEEPIVSTPQSAFKAVKEGMIDVLILEDYCVLPKQNLGT